MPFISFRSLFAQPIALLIFEYNRPFWPIKHIIRVAIGDFRGRYKGDDEMERKGIRWALWCELVRESANRRSKGGERRLILGCAKGGRGAGGGQALGSMRYEPGLEMNREESANFRVRERERESEYAGLNQSPPPHGRH